jgi:alpha-L-fucosidase
VKAYKQLVSQGNSYVLNAAPNREGRLMQSDIDALQEAAKVLGIARKSAK